MFNFFQEINIYFYNTMVATGDNAFLRGIQQNFSNRSINNYTFLFALSGLIVFVIILSNVTFATKKNKLKSIKQIGNPETVFNELLAYIELSQAEKRLLLEMAQGSRILHPSLFMLSPDLLDWAREVWINEKGKKVTKAHFKGIDKISLKLFNTLTPTTATRIKQKTMQSIKSVEALKHVEQPMSDHQVKKEYREIQTFTF